ncbi:uncharacterized protein LOC108883442 isoform X1 [Lates calcarifer]|uniref:Uncharacterized protein LOC108883442 isoform X1 n=1 Tax=Lates calcarifer TaxID=8187 RepID=A0AAJ7LU06_LATCA|nr:uncharacterized protein LOC108883442 isoform X1 [Lates calcarifer]
MKLKTVLQVLREVLSLGLVAQLMVGPPPAAAASPLSCSVTPQPDGSFRYQVSQPPRSSRCETLWERENTTCRAAVSLWSSSDRLSVVFQRTVLALNSRFVPHLVQNLTEQSITLRDCLDFLYYRVDCPPVGVDWEETNCSMNCSRFSHLDFHPPAGNCFFGSWCPDELTAALIIGAPAAAVVLALTVCFVVSKRRNRTGAVTLTASYTSVNEQVKMESPQLTNINRVDGD